MYSLLKDYSYPSDKVSDFNITVLSENLLYNN